MRTVFSLIFAFLMIFTISSSAVRSEEVGSPSEPTVHKSAPAQTLVSGLVPGSRILKTFDFEEKALGNYEPIPMYFNKVAGRGYPLFTGGKFVNDVYRSANTSFQLVLDGGSVAYRLAAGKLPINPQADYYIVGFVKTSALAHARTELTAWFADESGQLILDSEAHSERWASATGNDDWHLLQIYMPGMAAERHRASKPAEGRGVHGAKSSAGTEGGGGLSLVLQLGLLQPQQLGSPLGKYELYRQDIKGAAWWDDLVVFQLPRLAIATSVPGNIFAPGQRATLDMTVSDLCRTQLSAILTIQDALGTVVHRQTWPLHQTPWAPWNQQVELPVLPPGWYIGSLDVCDPKSVVVRRQTRFITTTALGPETGPAREFGVVATAWPVEAWNELPPILAQLGVGLVKLPAWRKDMSEESLLRKDQPFDQLILTLQKQEILSLASFSEIPSVLTERLNEKAADSILALLDADPNVWKPYVSFIMARYASRVNMWELGQERDAFYSADSRYPKLYQKTYQELATLLTTPKLVLPWNALYDFDPKQYPEAILDLKIPALIKPIQIPAYIDGYQKRGLSGQDGAVTGVTNERPGGGGGEGTEVLAWIEPLDASYPRAERLVDFVERIVLARSANPRAVLLDLPMQHQATLTSRSSQPDELLLVYRTLVRLLGGATCKGQMMLQPGVKALLFDRQGIGTLVLWNENAASAELKLDLPLGKAPVLVDYAGKVTPLEPGGGGTGMTTLTITPTPLIIDHVESPQIQLAGSFLLAQNTIPAGVGMLQTTVQLDNPYPEPLGGTLRLEPPTGWTMDPPSFRISLSGGAKLNQPITIRYPYTEFAGPKIIKARLMLDQDSSGRALELRTFVTVNSDLIGMECFPTITAGGELVLQQMITNLSGAALNAQAYAMVPGQARQQRFILDLKPGQTTIKRFTFPNAKALSGKAAALGIRNYDGTTILTKAVPLN